METILRSINKLYTITNGGLSDRINNLIRKISICSNIDDVHKCTNEVLGFVRDFCSEKETYNKIEKEVYVELKMMEYPY
jgi:hypothetical protein